MTDDLIRSLIISQRLLGTREVVLVHHSHCGMTTFRDEEVEAAIEADADVRRSIARVRASPFLPH